MTYRHTTVSALVMLVVACACTSAFAQVPAAPAQSPYINAQGGVTIEEMVVLALRQSQRTQAARDRTDAMRGDLTQAGLRPNPMVGLLQREQIGGVDRQTTVDVAWPLELSRRDARIEAAMRGVDVADAEVRRDEWNLALQVRRESFRVLAAIRALDLTRQQADAARGLRDLVGASVEAGALPRLDRDVAEVEVRRIEATIPLRQADIDGALLALKALAGLAPDQPLQFRLSLGEEIAAAVSVTAGLDLRPGEHTGRRPDLNVTHAELSRAQAQTALVRADGSWDLEFIGGYMRTAMSFPQFAFSAGGQLAPIAGRFHEITFGARIVLPSRNQGAIAAAAARERAAAADRNAAVLEATAEVRAAQIRWSALRESATAYAAGLLTLARQNLEVVQQTYLAGRATLNDVIAERRRLLDLEMTNVSVQGELGVADVELRRALGVIR